MKFGYVAALILLGIAWLVWFLLGNVEMAVLLLLSAIVIRTY